jgi:hypothetical protein
MLSVKPCQLDGSSPVKSHDDVRITWLMMNLYYSSRASRTCHNNYRVTLEENNTKNEKDILKDGVYHLHQVWL